MDYKILINDFEGPLDLLLHLIKQSDISIFDISIEQITKQYLDYITKMEELNLNIASEYLVMAAELIEMKSLVLLPNSKSESDDEYEEDPKEQLINRLLEYERYKEQTKKFKELEQTRHEIYTRMPLDMSEYSDNDIDFGDVTIDDLVKALNKFLERKELERPLNTKIATKEYSVHERSNQIKNILKTKKKVSFHELFESFKKDYVIVTFLSILDLAKKQELDIKQDNNFEEIYLLAKGVDDE